MEFEWDYSTGKVNFIELSELYKIAPLGEKMPEDLKKVFYNSMFKCFVFDNNNLIGVGRALADGADCSYICDVAVHTDCQGSGVGKSIVSKLVELSQGHKKILLYSYPGKEMFYKSFGFKRMSTAMAIFENQNLALEWGLVNDT